MNTNTVEAVQSVELIESQPQGGQLAPQVSSPSQLLQIAVQQGAGMDMIERLMAMQERFDAAEAKKASDAAFAAFKAEAITIVKNRQVTDGPLRGKSFAELHAWVNAVTPALSRHGLSTSWKLTKDERDWLEVTCMLKHVAGHCESVSMGGPPDAGGAKNAIQARASTISYLERYTLKAILGLSEQDEDTDGNAQDRKDEWIEKANSATSAKDLKEIFKAGSVAFTKAKDVAGYQKFATAVRLAGESLSKQPA